MDFVNEEKMEASHFRMWPVEMNFSEEDFMESLERALPPRLHLQPLPPLPVSLPPPPVTETHCVTVSEKRAIENLELSRNLLHCVEMQVNRKCNEELMKLLKKIGGHGLMMGATTLGFLCYFKEERHPAVIACTTVTFITEIIREEIDCYFALKRLRPRRSLIRMRRIALRNRVGELRDMLREPYNGFFMSPNNATIEIDYARARVVRIEDTLVSEIEGFDVSHTRFLISTFLACVICLVVVFSSGWFLGRGSGHGGRIPNNRSEKFQLRNAQE